MLDLTVQIRMRRHRFSLSFTPSSAQIRAAEIADFTDRKPRTKTRLHRSPRFPIYSKRICEMVMLGFRIETQRRRTKRIVLTIALGTTFRAYLALLALSLSISLFWEKKKRKNKFKTVFMWMRKRRGKWRKGKEIGCEMHEMRLKCKWNAGLRCFLKWDLFKHLIIWFYFVNIVRSEGFLSPVAPPSQNHTKGATRVTPAPPFGRFKSTQPRAG